MDGWTDGQGTRYGYGPPRVLPLHGIAPFGVLMCGLASNIITGEEGGKKYGRGVSGITCGTGGLEKEWRRGELVVVRVNCED